MLNLTMDIRSITHLDVRDDTAREKKKVGGLCGVRENVEFKGFLLLNKVENRKKVHF